MDREGSVPVAASPVVWRSLEDLQRTQAERVAHAARQQAATDETLSEGSSRRAFLQLMGAGAALAGLAGCTRQPLETIVPYVKQPEEIVPGKPLFFASSMTLGGFATGVLVESHMGRPTKIEGNPEHPASLGSSDRFAQAAVLGLYDPDRSQVTLQLGAISTWAQAGEAMRVALGEQVDRHGAGVRILTGTVGSPSLASQIQAFLTKLPQARWVQYEPDARDNVREATRLAFGEPLSVRHHYGAADVVLSLEADFLTSGPATVRSTRDFMSRRRVSGPGATMNRLYVVESMPTGTGSVADHRLALRPSEIVRFTAALASALGVPGVARPDLGGDPRAEHWVSTVAAELQRAPGRGLVVAGDYLPPELHVLVHAMNEVLGNVGATVTYGDPVEGHPSRQLADLHELVTDMNAGHVEMLIVLDANPVYATPADLGFAAAMGHVKLRVHLGLYQDETAELCHWHVPMTHFLETWSDGRAFDGTVTLQQPLIEPLYTGKSAHDVMAHLLDAPQATGLALVRDQWQARLGGERAWRRAVHDGLVAGSSFAARATGLRLGVASDAAAALAATELPGEGIEFALRLDASVHDGRFANNGWLQELPRPMTKIAWDNAAIVSPATAASLGVESGEVVTLSGAAGKVTAPICVLPGHSDRCVTVHLGYGRRRGGRVATGVGFDGFAIQSAATPWSGRAEVRPTGKRHALVTTQEGNDMARRNLVRSGTLEEFHHEPDFAKHVEHSPADDMTLYPKHAQAANAWGMSVDLSTCTGCNACVVACNSENNIPVVGKDQVRRGREMHWIRIDRYFEGPPEDPKVLHQPVMCMHCETAPCEVVCPVAATTHSPEGLNDMAYNRCVGTRYCSNNCPYKVRRFNFYMYSDLKTPVLQFLRNPDVTVRTRGVMEKCTYCVQRINHARIDAKNADRGIQDGDIVTACQQACPAEAIVFGDIRDPNSRVSKARAQERNYGILEDLNTRPRTTYLAKLRNPNPALEA